MKNYVVLIVFLTLGSVNMCYSNNLKDFDFSNRYVSANFGLSIGYGSSFETSWFINYGFNLNFIDSNNILSINQFNYREFTIGNTAGIEYFSQLGILYGKFSDIANIFNIIKFRVQAQVGLSLIYSELTAERENYHYGQHYEKTFNIAPGIPFLLEFRVLLFDLITAGIGIYGNVNPINTIVFFTPGISLQIGSHN